MSLRTVAAARARTMETDMRALKALWVDESGLVLSAEAVAVGTLGVMGAAQLVTRAVDGGKRPEELDASNDD